MGINGEFNFLLQQKKKQVRIGCHVHVVHVRSGV
jgi:hypothetical protein